MQAVQLAVHGPRAAHGGLSSSSQDTTRLPLLPLLQLQQLLESPGSPSIFLLTLPALSLKVRHRELRVSRGSCGAMVSGDMGAQCRKGSICIACVLVGLMACPDAGLGLCGPQLVQPTDHLAPRCLKVWHLWCNIIHCIDGPGPSMWMWDQTSRCLRCVSVGFLTQIWCLQHFK